MIRTSFMCREKEENKADNAILREIFRKRALRSNARLTKEEMACLDKYKLTMNGKSCEYEGVYFFIDRCPSYNIQKCGWNCGYIHRNITWNHVDVVNYLHTLVERTAKREQTGTRYWISSYGRYSYGKMFDMHRDEQIKEKHRRFTYTLRSIKHSTKRLNEASNKLAEDMQNLIKVHEEHMANDRENIKSRQEMLRREFAWDMKVDCI